MALTQAEIDEWRALKQARDGGLSFARRTHHRLAPGPAAETETVAGG